MLLALSSPADSDRGPRYSEQALAAIHQANAKRLPLVLEYGCHAGRVGLFCRVPPSLKATIAGQLAAAYPDCRLCRHPDDALDPPKGHQAWTVELRLRPGLFPIRPYAEYDDLLLRTTADPLTAILTALTPDRRDLIAAKAELTVSPTRPSRRRRAQRILNRLGRPFFRRHPRLASAYADLAVNRWLWSLACLLGLIAILSRREGKKDDVPRDYEDNLRSATDKIGRHLFSTRLQLIASGPPGSAHKARAKLDVMAGAFGQFTLPGRATFRHSRVRHRRRVPPRTPPPRRGFLLSTQELATLWHPATAMVRAEKMEINAWREMEPPTRIPSGKATDEALLGRIKFRSRRECFGIGLDDRFRHLAVIGKTGMGKSTLLHNLIASDVRAGRGVGLIDPHGDLAEAVLGCVPRRRTNDVVVFDAGDRSFPPAFNPLQCGQPDQRPLVASGVLSSFKKLYGDSWGPRLEHILRNALLALLETPGTSLLSLQRLLSDAPYRKTVIARISDPAVRSFWYHEFASWNERYRNEAVAPIQNKIGQFLSSPILRAIIGPSKGTIDFRELMDAGRVLIVNLSKGRIGDDASTLLGSLLVTGLQLAAMSRADTPETNRRDFFLYVDEFQNFATESFATILSEARKYRLALTLANQYLAQMDDATADAVFGNVGSLIAFQCGARDAEPLAEQLGGETRPQDMMMLPRFTAYVRLLVNGMPSRPFSMETLPSPASSHAGNRSDIIRRTSQQRYCRPVAQVEAEIQRVFAIV